MPELKREIVQSTTINHKILKQVIMYVAAFIIIFISYVFVVPKVQTNAGVYPYFAKFYGGLMLIGVFIYGFYIYKYKKMTYERKIFIIILLAFIIHLTYILYTTGYTRQHDTWSTNNNGHYDYALSFYLTGALPDHNITVETIYQFYHPPLNAAIEGAFMHVFETFSWNHGISDTPEDLFCACQILTCFYMFVTAVVFIKIINMSKLSENSKLMASAFVALYPRLTQLSGQLNNDALAIMLSAIALLYFCKWYFVKKNFLNIMLTSLFIGLAMMTKMSAVIICFGIGVAFIIELVRSIQKKKNSLKTSRLILQYVCFLALCAPLGLWFQLYTHFVYGLPFNFVFDRLNSALFVGTQDWVIANKPDRLDYYNSNNSGLIYTSNWTNILYRYIAPINIDEFFSGNAIFCSAWSNYNVLSYAIRSSIFGEFASTAGGGIYTISVISLYVLWFLFIIYLIYCLVKRVKIGRDGTFSLYLIAGIIAMYLYLQISMPFGCSMDFRYIVPIILPIGYLFGKANDSMSVLHPTNFTESFKNTLWVSMFVFLGSTYLFYFMAV